MMLPKTFIKVAKFRPIWSHWAHRAPKLTMTRGEITLTKKLSSQNILHDLKIVEHSSWGWEEAKAVKEGRYLDSKDI